MQLNWEKQVMPCHFQPVYRPIWCSLILIAKHYLSEKNMTSNLFLLSCFFQATNEDIPLVIRSCVRMINLYGKCSVYNGCFRLLYILWRCTRTETRWRIGWSHSKNWQQEGEEEKESRVFRRSDAGRWMDTECPSTYGSCQFDVAQAVRVKTAAYTKIRIYWHRQLDRSTRK